MEKITVAETVNAPVSKVWNAWNQPEHITKWNQASDKWHCPSAENDLRPGGTYKARMEAKDGSFGFDFEAVYDEVVDQQKISYTINDGRKATTHFEANGEITVVTTTFDADDQNPVEVQRGGWQAILNSFKNYVEKN